jgi:RNA polymerase sigma-70 factor (ECF subfamily)
VEETERQLRFERLFRAHAAVVAGYARRRTDPVSADDVINEVFAIAWRRLDDVPASPVPWLLGCARRVLWHQQRRLRRDHRLIERLRTVQPPLDLTPDPVLGSALAMLRQPDRELLLLIAWEGLAVDEAAQVLGCSPNTCAVRLHRARKRLQAALTSVDSTAEASLVASEEVVGE